MDKNLYVSYQCFKENPEYGIVVKMKDGQDYFYQVMADSYKIVRNKWQDNQLVASLNKNDVVCYQNLKEYIQEQSIDYQITDPELFLHLTKSYKLSPEFLEVVSEDIGKSKVLNTNTVKLKM